MSGRIYSLTFHEVGGRPVITWLTKHGYETREDVLAMFARREFTFTEHKLMPEAFLQSKGKHICRAARIVGAKAVIMEYVGDRKVTYRLIFEHKVTGGVTHYTFESVVAEGLGAEVRVTATLPSEETVTFLFHSDAEVARRAGKPVDTAGTNDSGSTT